MVSHIIYGSVCNHNIQMIWSHNDRNIAHIKSLHYSQDAAAPVARLSFVNNLVVAAEKRKATLEVELLKSRDFPRASSFPTRISWHKTHINARKL